METKIILNNQAIKCKIKKSRRAKRARLAVYCDASIVLTVPYYCSNKLVENFIQKNSKWLFAKINSFKKRKFSLIGGGKNDYLENRARAFEIAKQRADYFNSFYNFQFNKISIRNQKTRWGSCSQKRNLNFNYRIIYLPQHIADYIIVHELCHLKEFNHSRKFWNLVSFKIPNYLEIRRELRQ